MKKIKIIIKLVEQLACENKFSQAGNLIAKHKTDFIEMIKNGDNQTLLYAYEVCEYFNMRQIDCEMLRNK
jgi:hypothetical protein